MIGVSDYRYIVCVNHEWQRCDDSVPFHVDTPVAPVHFLVNTDFEVSA